MYCVWESSVASTLRSILRPMNHNRIRTLYARVRRLPVGAVRPHLHSSPGARSMRTANTVVLGVGSTNVAPRRTESCWNVTGSFPAKPREGSAYSSVTGPLSAWPEPGPLRLSKATVTIHRRHAGSVWSQRCMGLPRIRGAVSRRTSAPAHGAPAPCSLVGVMPGYATCKLAARDWEYTVERILAWTSKHRRTIRYLEHLSCNPRTCGP